MTSLNVPNDIVDGALVEAIDHQQNYQEIETHINDHLINKDASVAMVGELLLAGSATAALGATTKAQMEAADAAVTSTAASDATTKADAALVSAKAYSDGLSHIETQRVIDNVGAYYTTTSTPTNFLVTPTLTNAKAGYYIVSVSLDVTLLTRGYLGDMDPFVATLTVSGSSTDTSQIIWDHGADTHTGNRQTLSKVWILPAAAGARTFTVKVYQVGGTLGDYRVDGTSPHSSITALFVG